MNVTAVALIIFGVLFFHTPIVTAENLELASANVQQTINRPLARDRIRVVKLNDYGNHGEHRNIEIEARMLQDFANLMGLEIQWIDTFRPEEALQKLIVGDADVSISLMPIDRSYDSRILATEPIALQRFRVVGRNSDAVENPLGLNRKTLAVKLSSPLWPYLEQLREVLAGLSLQVLPDNLSSQEMLKLVSDRIYDTVLLADDFRSEPITHQSGLKYLFDLTGPEPVSWHVRADQGHLVEQLNEFIKRYHTAYGVPDSSVRHFSDIKQQGALRVITRFDGNNYFLNRGRPAGFELELARRFAKRHGLRLEVLVGHEDEQILQWLRSGAGDLITTRIHERLLRDRAELSVSRDYRHDAVVLISSATRPIQSKADISGKFIAGYEGSSTIAAATDFLGGDGTVIAVDRRVSLSVLIDRIESGTVDAAVIAGHQIKSVLGLSNGVIAGLSIPNPYRYRWTLRSDSPQMAIEIEKFIEHEYQKGTYNILERRYVARELGLQPTLTDISPFDELLQTYSELYDFDWRLIAAQMYQESQFNPKAVSRNGALGLMQIMPETAVGLGLQNPNDPEAGIRAGIKYLHWLRNRFDNHIPMDERTWLALAAYNIGYEHVRRARNRARKIGLNPDKWFSNVEVAMRQMTRSYWESSSLEGCRCGQAIIYVSSIRSLYYSYRNFVLAIKSSQQPASPQPATLAPMPLFETSDGIGS